MQLLWLLLHCLLLQRLLRRLLMYRLAIARQRLLLLLLWCPSWGCRTSTAQAAHSLPLLPPRLHHCLDGAGLQAVLLHKCHQLSSCGAARLHLPSQAAARHSAWMATAAAAAQLHAWLRLLWVRLWVLLLLLLNLLLWVWVLPGGATRAAA